MEKCFRLGQINFSSHALKRIKQKGIIFIKLYYMLDHNFWTDSITLFFL